MPWGQTSFGVSFQMKIALCTGSPAAPAKTSWPALALFCANLRCVSLCGPRFSKVSDTYWYSKTWYAALLGLSVMELRCSMTGFGQIVSHWELGSFKWLYVNSMQVLDKYNWAQRIVKILLTQGIHAKAYCLVQTDVIARPQMNLGAV